MRIFRQDKIELNRSDYQLIGAYLLVMCLWLGYRFYVEELEVGKATLYILLNIVKTLSGFFGVKMVLEYYLLRRQRWFMGLLSVLFVFITVGGSINIMGNLVGGIPPREAIYPLAEFIIRGFNTSLFDVALITGFVFSKKSYEQIINNKNLAIENRDNALKILRAQFSPHFLFNNLNTIDALIDDRPALAKQYITQLAGLYRYLTETVNEDVMPVADELAFIDNYRFLIEVRFGQDYRFTVVREQAIEGRFLPVGALQTAVENVVKHNAADTSPISTHIRVAGESITITNNKGSSMRTKGNGNGLRNLEARYALLSNDKPTVREDDQVFTLQLPLLLTQSD